MMKRFIDKYSKTLAQKELNDWNIEQEEDFKTGRVERRDFNNKSLLPPLQSVRAVFPHTAFL
jgi:hypothetical protein